MHPDDLLLLDPPSSTNQLAAASSNGTLGVGPTSQMVTAGSLKQNYHKPEVSWLRTTTYATKDTTGGTIKRGAGAGGSALGRSSSSTSMVKDEIEVDASMQAQVQAIERTFWHHDQYSFQPERGDEKEEDALARIKHPRKRDVHAVEAYDILPDDEMWGHNLVRVDYPERPAGKSGGRVSPQQFHTSIQKRATEHLTISLSLLSRPPTSSSPPISFAPSARNASPNCSCHRKISEKRSRLSGRICCLPTAMVRATQRQRAVKPNSPRLGSTLSANTISSIRWKLPASWSLHFAMVASRKRRMQWTRTRRMTSLMTTRKRRRRQDGRGVSTTRRCSIVSRSESVVCL